MTPSWHRNHGEWSTIPDAILEDDTFVVAGALKRLGFSFEHDARLGDTDLGDPESWYLQKHSTPGGPVMLDTNMGAVQARVAVAFTAADAVYFIFTPDEPSSQLLIENLHPLLEEKPESFDFEEWVNDQDS